MGSNRRRNSAQGDRDRRTIARNKPNCAICGRPIDYTLKWPDPMCFVVDHIHPLTKGGPDTLANKQPAHATCNSTKRARIVAPIIRRSGSLNR